MKTRCPSCGATSSLDVLVGHDGAREALVAAFKLSDRFGSAAVRYLALFRSESRELTMDRVARLLNELLPDIQAQRITRNGQTFEAPQQAWLFAFDQAQLAREQGRLKTPLKSHGWLYEVIASWKPQSADLLPTVPGGPRVPAPSRVGQGLSALEQWKHGE